MTQSIDFASDIDDRVNLFKVRWWWGKYWYDCKELKALAIIMFREGVLKKRISMSFSVFKYLKFETGREMLKKVLPEKKILLPLSLILNNISFVFSPTHRQIQLNKVDIGERERRDSNGLDINNWFLESSPITLQNFFLFCTNWIFLMILWYL